MNDNQIIGRNLKALREANSYTQEQAAAYLGVKRSAASRISILIRMFAVLTSYGCFHTVRAAVIAHSVGWANFMSIKTTI